MKGNAEQWSGFYQATMKLAWNNLKSVSCCIILLELPTKDGNTMFTKGKVLISSNALLLLRRQKCTKNIFPTLLHHSQQHVPLIQGRIWESRPSVRRMLCSPTFPHLKRKKRLLPVETHTSLTFDLKWLFPQQCKPSMGFKSGHWSWR